MHEPFLQLFEPLLHAVPPPGGWRLIDWDDEQGLCLILGRGDDELLLVELEGRDPKRPCYARTRRFNVCARRMNAGDAPALSVDERVVVDRLVRLVAQRETLLPDFQRPTMHRRAAVREIEVERLLVTEGAGQYYINPYVGCMIGCEFCYVAPRADFSRGLHGLPIVPWGRYVDVKVNAAAVLRGEVGEHEPGPVRLSPILTDPYQPVERRYRVTRQCLEVLRDAGYTPVILTRAARVLDDLELLASFPRAAVGLSIPTDDDNVRRQFEPGADPISERIDALEQLSRAGVRTFAVVQPVLPGDPARLVARIAPHIRFARVDRMHFMSQARRLYRDSGWQGAATDEFFDEMCEQLREELRAAGVAVDDLDDMGAMIAS